MRRRHVLLGGCACWLAGGAAAQATQVTPTPPAELAGVLPNARLQGQGRLTFFGLHVYDARLWTTAAPAADWAAAPLALELVYARGLKGAQIAERSLKEMQRQGPIAAEQGSAWLAAMQQIFPDVKEGDRITGLHQPGQGARFFLNGRTRGDVADAGFSRMFFGIWLSDKTSEPALRNALLGRAP